MKQFGQICINNAKWIIINIFFLLLPTVNLPLQIGKCTTRGTCTPVSEPLCQRVVQALKIRGKSSRLHWKKIEVLDFRFFVGDVISEVGFRPFWLRLPGCEQQPLERIFNSSFYWKLSYNLGLLRLWLAIYHFWFKSYGLKHQKINNYIKLLFQLGNYSIQIIIINQLGLAGSLEGLDSLLAQSTGKLWHCKVAWK